MDEHEARLLRLQLLAKVLDGIDAITEAIGQMAVMDGEEVGVDVKAAKVRLARPPRPSRRTH